MKAIDYIYKKTDEFSNSPEENKSYSKFLIGESLLALGSVLIANKTKMPASYVLACGAFFTYDILSRAVTIALHKGVIKPASGLVGKIRELYSLVRKN